ncbi:MAG: hypothetical protein MJZ20_01340 [Bacteroidaceae bacterium]|nr:hypothetical protein [Bacteroidaceae bacterium]
MIRKVTWLCNNKRVSTCTEYVYILFNTLDHVIVDVYENEKDAQNYLDSLSKDGYETNFYKIVAKEVVKSSGYVKHED